METEEITGSVKELEGKAEKAYGRGKEKIRSAADELLGESSNTRQQIYDRAEETWDSALEAVRRRPASAVGVALAAGLILGGVIAWAANRD